MPYGTARKELYRPTIDDVVAALTDLNKRDYTSKLYAYGVSDVGEKIQRMKGFQPPYIAWTKQVSQVVLVRILGEAVEAKLVVHIDGRREAALYGLTKGGMRERGSSYYITTEDFIAAKANQEAYELGVFRQDLRKLAQDEVVRRHMVECDALYDAGMTEYKSRCTGQTTSAARAQVLDETEKLFTTVVV